MRGTGSALHETVGALVDLTLEAESPLGFQQCRDHASPSAFLCTMWARFRTRSITEEFADSSEVGVAWLLRW